jgi:valyl-tRNA synthetase
MDDFSALLKEITKEMDEYKFYLVGEKLYHYVWHEFADKILEESKSINDSSRQSLLLQIHRKILIALHPFMPFITEEIWSTNEKSPLIIEPWVV